MERNEVIRRLETIQAVAEARGAQVALIYAPECSTLEQALETMSPDGLEANDITGNANLDMEAIRNELSGATRAALGFDGQVELTPEQAAQVEQALQFGSFQVVRI